MNIISLAFSEKLATVLRQSNISYEGFNCHKVCGKLSTEMTIAPIEIVVPPDQTIREIPPKVWCRKPWMRDSPDWHNSTKLGMCWVLEEQWQDEMNNAHISTGDFLNIGTEWLVVAVSNLIDRHCYGHCHKLVKWPKDWLAFAHYHQGVKQYEREKKTNKRRCKI